MSVRCPVCGSEQVEVRRAFRAVHPAYAGLQLAHCLKCELAFASPMPSVDALVHYNSSYFDSAHGGHTTSILSKAFFAAIARLRMAHIERFIQAENIKVTKVLEIGPGPGFFARAWLEQHPETYYSAVETDRSCDESLKQLGVHLVSIGTPVQPSERADLVVISHVLEHVSDPIAFIYNATRRLRVGGVLFIEVPCRDWEHKPLDEPHLLFFDKRSMQRVLDATGFGSVQVGYYGKTIAALRSPSFARRIWEATRIRSIARGLVTPFARTEPGMEPLINPLERAVVRPYAAHVESKEPAWWLRALAVKRDEP